MPSEITTPQLKIFYDGGCKVCAWEVNKYLSMDREARLGVIDIDAPGFEAEKYGLDRLAVRKYFHVLTSDGKVIAGVDAFIEIWKTLGTPLSLAAAKVARLAPVHGLLSLGYQGFIVIRPYLPRNPPPGVSCEGDACSLKEVRKST